MKFHTQYKNMYIVKVCDGTWAVYRSLSEMSWLNKAWQTQSLKACKTWIDANTSAMVE